MVALIFFSIFSSFAQSSSKMMIFFSLYSFLILTNTKPGSPYYSCSMNFIKGECTRYHGTSSPSLAALHRGSNTLQHISWGLDSGCYLGSWDHLCFQLNSVLIQVDIAYTCFSKSQSDPDLFSNLGIVSVNWLWRQINTKVLSVLVLQMLCLTLLYEKPSALTPYVSLFWTPSLSWPPEWQHHLLPDIQPLWQKGSWKMELKSV